MFVLVVCAPECVRASKCGPRACAGVVCPFCVIVCARMARSCMCVSVRVCVSVCLCDYMCVRGPQVEHEHVADDGAAASRAWS